MEAVQIRHPPILPFQLAPWWVGIPNNLSSLSHHRRLDDVVFPPLATELRSTTQDLQTAEHSAISNNALVAGSDALVTSNKKLLAYCFY